MAEFSCEYENMKQMGMVYNIKEISLVLMYSTIIFLISAVQLSGSLMQLLM